jgi:hypothetical protein
MLYRIHLAIREIRPDNVSQWWYSLIERVVVNPTTIWTRPRPPELRVYISKLYDNIGHDFLNRAQLQRQPLQVYVISMLQRNYTIIITNRFTVRKYLFLKCQWIISFYVCLFVSSFTDKILPNCIMGDTGRLIWNRSYLLYEHLVIPCWSSL